MKNAVFLVTHTSLVEAENETAAANDAYAKITASEQLTFSVRSDESHTRQVTVPICQSVQRVCDLGDQTQSVPEDPSPSGAEASNNGVEPETQPTASGTGPSFMRYGSAVVAIAVFYGIVHFFL